VGPSTPLIFPQGGPLTLEVKGQPFFLSPLAMGVPLPFPRIEELSSLVALGMKVLSFLFQINSPISLLPLVG